MIKNNLNCPVILKHNLRELQIDCFRWAMQNNMEVSKASQTEFICFNETFKLEITYADIDFELNNGNALETVLGDLRHWNKGE